MLRKSKKNNDEEEVSEPRFVLMDRINRKVWHEQFYTRSEAQGKIDYEKTYNGLDGNWEILEV